MLSQKVHRWDVVRSIMRRVIRATLMRRRRRMKCSMMIFCLLLLLVSIMNVIPYKELENYSTARKLFQSTVICEPQKIQTCLTTKQESQWTSHANILNESFLLPSMKGVFDAPNVQSLSVVRICSRRLARCVISSPKEGTRGALPTRVATIFRSASESVIKGPEKLSEIFMEPTYRQIFLTPLGQRALESKSCGKQYPYIVWKSLRKVFARLECSSCTRTPM